MTQHPDEETPATSMPAEEWFGGLSATQVVAKRVRELRAKRGWSAQALATRCAEADAPHLDRSVIANLETGRRRSLSVDELLVLAYVLDVAPVYLFIPTDNRPIQIANWVVPAGRAREWVRGRYALGGQDEEVYWAERPEEEWDALTASEGKRPATSEELKAFFGDNIEYVGPPAEHEEGD